MEVNQEKREEWVDCVKVVACVLVVLGHFFQSMTKAGIIAEGTLWKWFDQMIYCFHVQLFFICSGYLYQRKNQIHRIDAWRRRILEKAVVLGIPYAVFFRDYLGDEESFFLGCKQWGGRAFKGVVCGPPFTLLVFIYIIFMFCGDSRHKKREYHRFHAGNCPCVKIVCGIRGCNRDRRTLCAEKSAGK